MGSKKKFSEKLTSFLERSKEIEDNKVNPQETNNSDKLLENYPDLIIEEYKFLIAKNQAPLRLDVFLTKQVLNATRTRVQKAFDNDLISVNGQISTKASKKVIPGDVVICKMLKYPPVELIPQDIPIEVVYEDEFLLVVNKPQGMVTHPGVGNRYGTLVNAVMFHLGIKDKLVINNLSDEEEEDGDQDEEETDSVVENLPIEKLNDSKGSDGSKHSKDLNNLNVYEGQNIRPGVVHRLDKDTSGLLIISKNVTTHSLLQKQFANRTISRTYLTLAWGLMPEKAGRLTGDIGRSSLDRKKFAVVTKNGKTAITDYKVKDEFGFVSLLELKLQTGRTHQIRVHLSHNKRPIFGDSTYGGDKVLFGYNYSNFKHIADKSLKLANGQQVLHAHKLTFFHPNLNKTIELEAPLNPIMLDILGLMNGFKNEYHK